MKLTLTYFLFMIGIALVNNLLLMAALIKYLS